MFMYQIHTTTVLSHSVSHAFRCLYICLLIHLWLVETSFSVVIEVCSEFPVEGQMVERVLVCAFRMFLSIFISFSSAYSDRLWVYYVSKIHSNTPQRINVLFLCMCEFASVVIMLPVTAHYRSL